MYQTCVIIPCFNESARLSLNSFINFSETHPELHFIFINDGSTDNTKQQLEKLHALLISSSFISYSENLGKAEAVRRGILYGLEKGFSYVGYLDADLSTTLSEFYRLKEIMTVNNLDLILGSRIKKLDTNITRSLFRHFLGRAIATIIDIKFTLGIYDTQCGAKIFKSSVLKEVIEEPFLTKWFFDVELLLRIKKSGKLNSCAEVPLQVWISKKGSKLRLCSVWQVLKDLLTLLSITA